MKNRPRITRVQLNIGQNEDFSLIGIVSSEPDYRLSLSLNKKLGLSLKNSRPVILHEPKNNELHFSRFSDHTGTQGFAVNLISNRSGNSLLIRKLKNIDYIFQVFSYGKEFSTEDMTLSLRTIETITAVFILEKGELSHKNLQYLIP
jgi:hypothetical protein